MSDQMFAFRSLLADLMEQAKISGNILEESYIREFFADRSLGEKEMNHIFAYLKASHIEIKNYTYNEEVEKEVSDYKKAAKERLEAFQAEDATEVEDSVEKELDTEGASYVLTFYLDSLNAIEPMSEEEEDLLLTRLCKGEESLESEYIERKLHSVVEIAKGFALSNHYFEELIEEGNIGLLMGMKYLKEIPSDNPRELIDAEILNAMQRFLKESIEVENSEDSMVSKVSFISDAAKKLKEENGVSPTVQELASYTNLTEEEVMEIIRLSAEQLLEP